MDANETDFITVFEEVQSKEHFKNRIAKRMMERTPVWPKIRYAYENCGDNTVLARQLAAYYTIQYSDKAVQDSADLLCEWEIGSRIAEKRAVITNFFIIYGDAGLERAKQWLNS